MDGEDNLAKFEDKVCGFSQKWKAATVKELYRLSARVGLAFNSLSTHRGLCSLLRMVERPVATLYGRFIRIN